MKPFLLVRNGVLVAGLALAASQVTGQQQPGATAQIRNGEIGFVVSSMRNALLADGVTVAEACPQGQSLAPADAYAKLPAERRAAFEAQYEAAAAARLAAAGPNASTQPQNRGMRGGVRGGQTNIDGSAVCLNPAPMGPDPSFRTVDNVVRADGIDIDGRTSKASDRQNGDTCAHDDMIGADGVRNIDNQYARILSCIPAYAPGGSANESFEGAMREGLWTLVIKLSKVDNLLNDPDVDVLIASSEDPLKLNASGTPVRNVTYEAHSDPMYRTVTKGRIVNGVLTTTPVDMTYFVRLPSSVRPSAMTQIGARFKLTIAPDGSASGVMAGYEDVERMAHVNFAVGGNAGIASGGAQLAKYTCNGIYYSMLRYADGKRDPKTGKCTAISTQWKISAGPAFVIAPPVAATKAATNEREKNG